jgi:hypothetical protein
MGAVTMQDYLEAKESSGSNKPAPDDEDDANRTELVCKRGHSEVVDDVTADLEWFCERCGARRTPVRVEYGDVGG